uniref:Uncharacterized protein n=1 Tax=Trichogramma kaykai TaxID=54128 RepID=A0ABD2WS62_9HYME
MAREEISLRTRAASCEKDLELAKFTLWLHRKLHCLFSPNTRRALQLIDNSSSSCHEPTTIIATDDSLVVIIFLFINFANFYENQIVMQKQSMVCVCVLYKIYVMQRKVSLDLEPRWRISHP